MIKLSVGESGLSFSGDHEPFRIRGSARDEGSHRGSPEDQGARLAWSLGVGSREIALIRPCLGPGSGPVRTPGRDLCRRTPCAHRRAEASRRRQGRGGAIPLRCRSNCLSPDVAYVDSCPVVSDNSASSVDRGSGAVLTPCLGAMDVDFSATDSSGGGLYLPGDVERPFLHGASAPSLL